MFTITLSDGTKLENLSTNNSFFISENEITKETFDGKLYNVEISGEIDEENGIFPPVALGTHERMKLVTLQKKYGQYWFVIRDITAKEIKEAKLDANIMYVAMMTGVDLPD